MIMTFFLDILTDMRPEMCYVAIGFSFFVITLLPRKINKTVKEF